MIVRILIYLTLIASSLARIPFDKDKCVELVCYMPEKCKGGSTSMDLALIKPSTTVSNPEECDFYFMFRPYSATKIMVQTSSKSDLDVHFHDGSRFFTCAVNNDAVTVLTGSLISESLETEKVNDRIYCRFFLTSKGNTIFPDSDLDELKVTHGSVQSIMRQRIMRDDIRGQMSCNPDSITFDEAKFSVTAFNLVPVNAVFSTASCPSFHKFMISHPGVNSGKVQDAKSIVCEKDGTEWKYRIKSEGGLQLSFSNKKFDAACLSTDKVCRLCTAPVHTCQSYTFSAAGNPICPSFTKGADATKDCHTFACPSPLLLQTDKAASRDGATCTLDSASGQFQWTAANLPFLSAGCAKEVRCNDAHRLTKKCDPGGCDGMDLKKPPLRCASGFTMTALIDGATVSTESIECNRSTTEWVLSNGRSIADSFSFNCTASGLAGSSTGSPTEASEQTTVSGMVIGISVIGGVLVVAIIIAVCVACVLQSRKKKAAKQQKAAAAAAKSAATPTTAPTGMSSSGPPSKLQQAKSQQKPSESVLPPSSSSADTPKTPVTPPLPEPALLHPAMPPIVVVVKQEEAKKSKKESRREKKTVRDENSRIADEPSATGEKLTEKTGEKTKERSNERSKDKSVGTLRDQRTITKSDVQKRRTVSEKQEKQEKQDEKTKKTTENSSESFYDAYTKELDKKMGKLKKKKKKKSVEL